MGTRRLAGSEGLLRVPGPRPSGNFLTRSRALESSILCACQAFSHRGHRQECLRLSFPPLRVSRQTFSPSATAAARQLFRRQTPCPAEKRLRIRQQVLSGFPGRGWSSGRHGPRWVYEFQELINKELNILRLLESRRHLNRSSMTGGSEGVRRQRRSGGQTLWFLPAGCPAEAVGRPSGRRATQTRWREL